MYSSQVPRGWCCAFGRCRSARQNAAMPTNGPDSPARDLEPAGQVAAVASDPKARTAFLVTLLIGAAAVLAGTIGAGEVYEEVVEGNGITPVDQSVLDWVVAHRNSAMDAIAAGFAYVGGTVGWTLVTIAIGLLFARRLRSWLPVVLFAVATAGSVAMTVAGKDLVGRTRPPQALAVPPFEHSPSFPSGHTLNTTVVVLIAVYLVTLCTTSQAARVGALVAALAFAGAMGLSRVYLGAHWLTDVAAGWLLAIAWTALVVLAHRTAVHVRRSSPATS